MKNNNESKLNTFIDDKNSIINKSELGSPYL